MVDRQRNDAVDSHPDRVVMVSPRVQVVDSKKVLAVVQNLFGCEETEHADALNLFRSGIGWHGVGRC